MNAFAKAWKILKAEIDFIEPGDKPEDIAYKRMWLYNELDRTPEDNPDRYAEEGGWDAIPKWDLENEPEEKHKTYRQSYLDRYGHMVPSGQANTDYGYEQKQTYRGLEDDRSKPIFGEGRLLINLPGMTDTARWLLSEEYEKENPRPPSLFNHPDYTSYADMPDYPSWDDPDRAEKKAARDALIQRNNMIERRNRLDRERWSEGNQDYYDENIEDRLIDNLISMINHEVGHTTQPEEEHDWIQQYAHRGGKYDVSNRARGDTFNERFQDNISGIMRQILMQESLASIFEDPFNEISDWKQKVAEYGMNDLSDHHDMQREVSHSMAKFFAENPQFYRSPEQVNREKAELRALLYGGDD